LDSLAGTRSVEPLRQTGKTCERRHSPLAGERMYSLLAGLGWEDTSTEAVSVETRDYRNVSATVRIVVFGKVAWHHTRWSFCCPAWDPFCALCALWMRVAVAAWVKIGPPFVCLVWWRVKVLSAPCELSILG
jgi:hypothetical protein